MGAVKGPLVEVETTGVPATPQALLFIVSYVGTRRVCDSDTYRATLGHGVTVLTFM